MIATNLQETALDPGSCFDLTASTPYILSGREAFTC